MMNSFSESDIPNLDVAVLAALELFNDVKVPAVKINFKRPLVVGSGNAASVGRILFSDTDAIFADESNFKKKLKSADGVVLISASGGKHSPLIAREAKKARKKVVLLTNNSDSAAAKISEEVFVFPKNREPYTYNTSTYLGMILGKTRENPSAIRDFISRLKINSSKLKSKKFYFLVPNEFEEIIPMLNVKFIELFGRNVARDFGTFESVKHAHTLIRSDELFISFGEENKIFGKSRMFVPLPSRADYGTMLAVGYYLIGKIQATHQAYFKENVGEYVDFISKVFGEKIGVIVE